MRRWIFRRRKRTQAELGELAQAQRDAEKARHQAERDMAIQRDHIEAFLDRHPPPFDSGQGGPF
jgi:hypothetical protein